MRHNISPTESDVRGVILAPAALLIAVGMGLETAGGVIFLTTAAMLLISAFTGYSPMYDLLGASETDAS